MKTHTLLTLIGLICVLPISAQQTLHALPEYQLHHPALPDARDLYQRALDCWPIASHFRAELSLEGRIGPRSSLWQDASGQISISPTPLSAALVARLPLYSASELDHEREREWQRRRRAAE